MKIGEMALELSKDNVVELGTQGVTLDKSIRCIIGGIPIYDIKICQCDGLITETMRSFDEMFEKLFIFNEVDGIHVCNGCDCIIDEDYYFDMEHNKYFCCRDCLEEWLNDFYGCDMWMSYDDTDFFVKISKEEAMNEWDDAVKINGEWWRQCCIARYHNNMPINVDIL